MAMQAQTLPFFFLEITNSLSVTNRVTYNLKRRVTFCMTSVIFKAASNNIVGWNRN
jgi:hypothetical protein